MIAPSPICEYPPPLRPGKARPDLQERPALSTPRFKDEWLVRLISARSGITTERTEEFRAQGRRYLSQALVDAGLMCFDEIGKIVHETYRIEYADITATQLNPSVLSLVPEKVCRRHDILPLEIRQRSVRLAMPNPLDVTALQEVEWVTGFAVEPLYCLPEHLDRLAEGTMSPDAVIFNLLQRLGVTDTVKLVESSTMESEQSSSHTRSPVVHLVNGLLANAVKMGASDIHIEHSEQSSLVRYRVDGLLRNIMQIPRYVGVGPVVSRLKIMAHLDIADRLRSQDGRAEIVVGDVKIGLRVSTLPTRLGEKMVLRILDARSAQVPLEKLAFTPAIARRMEALLALKQGLLLVTGPTGSGKTTTLYAALNRLRCEVSNVITVEDPVEYRLEGVNQVQVQEQQGRTFANVLRSVLRQDPDVIMVGEIRDRETAEVAFQAAFTGHLVLSTLHTNDAVSAVVRLADMGVDRFKVAAGVVGVTAQRLVRRLCSACAQSVPDDDIDPILRCALRKVAPDPQVRVPKGCSQCSFSGYKGRLPVVEFLQITPQLREKISAGATVDELQQLAVETGALHTMEQDALGHLAAGNVPLSEVLAYLHMAPAPPSKVEHVPAEPGGAKADAPGDRVLVAIGDSAESSALQSTLEAYGYVVETASNGADAVAALAKGAPDLVVLEAALPILDARKVITTVRAVLGLTDLPILVWSPDDQAPDTSALTDAGANDIVSGRGMSEKIAARLSALQFRRGGWSSTEEVMRPRIPSNEPARLADVRSTNVLDTPREERFDALTRKAQEVFNVPMALVTLVDEDRQWIKSAQGLDVTETSREDSFCAHAIHGPEVLVVPDAALDPRFAENPFVLGNPHVRFYAGYPISGPGGHKLGALCILDSKPRDFCSKDEDTLRSLGHLVEAELSKTA